MIKILHMSTSLDGGGVEMFLLNYYKNIDRDKIHFSIVVPGYKKGILEDQFIELGAKVYHVGLLHDNFINSIRDIRKIFKNNNFDIVHCHGNKSSLLGIIFGKLYGVKVRIVHAHMTEEVVVYFKKIYKKFTQIIIKLFATDLFACGRDAGNYLFGKQKFTIIHNAIDLEKFLYNAEIRKEYRDDLGMNNEILLGNVARFAVQKNHSFLIEVFYELLKINPNYKLVLIGEGDLKKSIEEKCEILKISDKIIFIKNTNHINEFMNSFDIGILPSLYEGLPVVAIEMQASGLPVVCSNTITNEVNITGKINYLDLSLSAKYWANTISTIQLNNAMLRNKQNEDMHNSNYDIKVQAHRLEKLYEGFMNEKN